MILTMLLQGASNEMGHGRRRRIRLRTPRRIPLLDPKRRSHVHRRHLDALVLCHPAQERRPRGCECPGLCGRSDTSLQNLYLQSDAEDDRGTGEVRGQGTGGGSEGYGAKGRGEDGEGCQGMKKSKKAWSVGDMNAYIYGFNEIMSRTHD